jgi:hypothetical protein
LEVQDWTVVKQGAEIDNLLSLAGNGQIVVTKKSNAVNFNLPVWVKQDMIEHLLAAQTAVKEIYLS